MDNTPNGKQEIISSYPSPYDVDMRNMNSSRLEEYISKTLKISASLGKILTGFSTAEFIEEKLGPAFGLNVEQKKEIARIIRDLILSDIGINQLENNISSRLAVDMNAAKQISDKLKNELLSPIMNELLQNSRLNQNNTSPVNPNNIIDLRNNG